MVLLKRFVLHFATFLDVLAKAAAMSVDATPVDGATVNFLRLHMSSPPLAEAAPEFINLMSLGVSTDLFLRAEGL